MDFKKKYIKYKTKYLELKKNVGGGKVSEAKKFIAKSWKKLTNQKSCNNIKEKIVCNRSWAPHGISDDHPCYWNEKNNVCQREKSNKLLGEGGFGKVIRINNDTVKKKISKIKLASYGISEDKVDDEIKILNNIKYPFSSYLKDYGYSDSHIVLFLNLINGKDLRKYQYLFLTKNDYKYIITQMLLFNYYNGSNGIIHLDLKPENYIYNQTNKNLYIIDYGISKCIDKSSLCEKKLVVDNKSIEKFGTIGYMPPSMKSDYDELYVNYLDDYYILALIIFLDLYPFSDFGKKIYSNRKQWQALIHIFPINTSKFNKLDYMHNVFEYLKQQKIYNIDTESKQNNAFKLFKHFVYDYFERYKEQKECLEDKVCNSTYHSKNVIQSFSFFGINKKDEDLDTALKFIDKLHENHIPNEEIPNIESFMAGKRDKLWKYITAIANKIEL